MGIDPPCGIDRVTTVYTMYIENTRVEDLFRHIWPTLRLDSQPSAPRWVTNLT